MKAFLFFLKIFFISKAPVIYADRTKINIPPIKKIIKRHNFKNPEHPISSKAHGFAHSQMGKLKKIARVIRQKKDWNVIDVSNH